MERVTDCLFAEQHESFLLQNFSTFLTSLEYYNCLSLEKYNHDGFRTFRELLFLACFTCWMVRMMNQVILHQVMLHQSLDEDARELISEREFEELSNRWEKTGTCLFEISFCWDIENLVYEYPD